MKSLVVMAALLVLGCASPTPVPVWAKQATRPASLKYLRPMNKERLRELRDWTEMDERIRLHRRWLFVSDTVALDSFGTPTFVQKRDGIEYWTYWIEERVFGPTAVLEFNDRRLINVLYHLGKEPRTK